MKVLEYLQKKYGVEQPNSLLNSEAKIFGIPTPLQSGWLQRYAAVEITPPMAFRLLQSLEVRAKKGRRFAQTAMDVLNGLPVEQPVRKKKPKKKAKGLRKTYITYPVSCNSDVSGNDFLYTYEWRRLRMTAIKKYGAKCQCCGATPATGAVMNVDHIKPRKVYPELALDINNLQVLCHECNHGKGNWDMTDWRKKETA